MGPESGEAGAARSRRAVKKLDDADGRASRGSEIGGRQNHCMREILHACMTRSYGGDRLKHPARMCQHLARRIQVNMACGTTAVMFVRHRLVCGPEGIRGVRANKGTKHPDDNRQQGDEASRDANEDRFCPGRAHCGFFIRARPKKVNIRQPQGNHIWSGFLTESMGL